MNKYVYSTSFFVHMYVSVHLPERMHSLSTVSTGSQTEVYCGSISHKSAGLPSKKWQTHIIKLVNHWLPLFPNLNFTHACYFSGQTHPLQKTAAHKLRVICVSLQLSQKCP